MKMTTKLTKMIRDAQASLAKVKGDLNLFCVRKCTNDTLDAGNLNGMLGEFLLIEGLVSRIRMSDLQFQFSRDPMQERVYVDVLAFRGIPSLLQATFGDYQDSALSFYQIVSKDECNISLRQYESIAAIEQVRIYILSKEEDLVETMLWADYLVTFMARLLSYYQAQLSTMTSLQLANLYEFIQDILNASSEENFISLVEFFLTRWEE
jgi:hypothetical protein